jgi:hypothetical protein
MLPYLTICTLRKGTYLNSMASAGLLLEGIYVCLLLRMIPRFTRSAATGFPKLNPLDSERSERAYSNQGDP